MPDSSFEAYRLLWCFQALASAAIGGRDDATSLAHASLIAVVAATPSRPLWAAAAAVRVGATVSKMPAVWDSMYWQLMTDAALLWCLATSQPFSRLQATVRAQMAVFYAASAFWKLNTSFLDPRTSCASVFAAQHAALYAPAAAPWAVAVAPAATLAVEALVALALAAAPRAGGALALAFHGAICATPPPNNVATFALSVAPQLALFAPRVDAALVRPATAAAAAAAVAMLRGATGPLAPQRWASVAYVALLGPILRALRRRGGDAPARPNRVFVAAALVYASTPCLGVLELGAPNMYANLRSHGGGGNHLLLPTGLLPDFFRDAAGSVFFGGEVVVEATTSASMRDAYPGDLTSTLEPPGVVDLLGAAGAPTRFFNAAKRRVLGFDGVAPADRAFAPFAVPALELRRAIADARGTGAFELTYARGDRRVAVSFDRGGAVARCRVAERGRRRDCADDEVALLPAPPYWARKLLLYLPYPVLDGDGGEVTCFGP